MKILFICFSNHSVYQNATFVQCRVFSKETKSDVFCVCPDNCSGKEEIYDNCLQISVPKRPKPSLSSLRLFNSQKKKIISYAKNNHVDVVYFICKHFWNFLLLKSFKTNGIKIIHAIHDPLGHEGDKVSKAVRLYNKVLTKRVDGCVAFSDKSFCEITERLKVKKPCVQLPFIQTEWGDFHKKDTTHKNILFFGRLNNYKGLEFLPKLSECLLELDNKITIIIAGKKGKDVQNDTLEALREQPNIKLIDTYIDEKEVDDLFLNSLICLMPYKTITQSGVIIDSYFRSTPICAFNIEGIAQFVSNDNSLLIEPFNVEKMAKEIVALLENKDLLSQKSFLSWKKGFELFSPKKWADGFNTFITSIL